MPDRSRPVRGPVAGLGAAMVVAWFAAVAGPGLALALALSGCGSSTPAKPVRRPTPSHGIETGTHRPALGQRRPGRSRWSALVTDPAGNRLLVVSVPGIRVLRAVSVPGEPEYVAGTRTAGPIAVVSARSAQVRLLGGPALLGLPVPTSMVAPHVTELAPGGGFLYVTDDGSGRADVIGLVRRRIVSRRFVGFGAHHLAFNATGSRVWIVLGQSARTVAILSTATPPPAGVTGGNWVDPARPRVVARLHPGYRAHDIKFSPDGADVWITSASGPTVGVFDARTHRLRLRVPGGAPPQHVVFGGPFAYVTSGYGSMIEQIRWSTGHVVRRVWAPYGSFELDAAGPYVVTSSLLRGTLAIYDRNLHLLRVKRLAATAEDVALVSP